MINIIEYPDPRLNEKFIEVDVVDETVRNLLVEMENTLVQHRGIGIVAPPVGVLKRIIIVRTQKKPHYLINPKIVDRKGKYMCTESCLSIPKQCGKVLRDRFIKVVALNEMGKKVVLDFSCFEACCVQHEIDHLDGVLFIDR